MLIYSIAAVRALDRRAVSELGLSGAQLMDRAGTAAARLVLQRWPLAQVIEILCGAGNNGGDGYVVALQLHQAVRQVVVHTWGMPDAKRSPDAHAALEKFLAAGGQILDAKTEPSASRERLAQADLVVDALFGLGTKPLSGDIALAISALNALEKPVLALDLPSGLHAETGAAALAVRASVTLSFIAPKLGLYTGNARACVGEVLIDTLQLPEAFLRSEPAWASSLTDLPIAHRRRSPCAHKGTHGHVYVIGGTPGMGGAVCLSAQAALRCGAGLVSVISDASHIIPLLIAQPELMFYPHAELPDAKLGSVLAIGPGLGTTSVLAEQYFARALSWPGAKIFDADALNLLAQRPIEQQQLGPAAIITPHPGEAARLLECSVAAIEADRPAAVRALVRRFGCVAVLKGAGTLLASPDCVTLRVCRWGNPGMASGGMGDVLTGVIAALLAQGLTPLEAAEQGVALHAKAADAAAKFGERGLLASDVIAQLRGQINGLAS